MRDGIPRSLPVPRKWQRFVECADRPADRGTDRPAARLQEAIRDDMRRDLSNNARKHLKKVTSSAEGFLPGFEFAGASGRELMIEQNHHLHAILRRSISRRRRGEAAGSPSGRDNGTVRSNGSGSPATNHRRSRGKSEAKRLEKGSR
jgi:hypothetical protein